MKARAVVFASVLAALSLGPASAEQAPRRVLLYMVALAGSTVADTELAVLYETLLARLADEAPALVVSEAPTVGAAPASAAERSREARREGADAWLWVGVGAGAGTLVLRVQTFDILAGGDPRERTFEKPRRDRNEDSLWDEVIGEALSGFAQAAPRGDVREAEVRVRAAPGTRIGGLPGGEIVMGVSGEATVRLAAFATYTLTATHPRFRPFAKSFYLRETPLVVECEQASIGPWALELGLDKLAYPSFRLTWFGVPDRLFVSFGWTSFTVGIPLWGDEAGTDLPLNQIGASVGIYLGRPTSLFRPYAGAEAFIRLLNNGSGDWLGIELESSSRMGFGLSAGLEAGRHPVVRPFFQYNPRAYVLTDPGGIELYYETLDIYGEKVPGYVYIGPLLADLFNFEAGVRIRL